MKTKIDDILIKQRVKNEYFPIRIITEEGKIDTRYYHAPESKKAIIFVGGVSGKFVSPAQEVYSKLCRELQLFRISSLFIKLENMTDTQQSIFDVLTGMTFLQNIGLKEIALIGYSSGGSIVIQSAAIAQNVSTVVTLATQSYGAEAVKEFAPQTSLLLLHGANDDVLSPSCSLQIHKMAPYHKNLIIFEKAGHTLDEVAQDVQRIMLQWLISNLISSQNSIQDPDIKQIVQ